MPDAQAPRLPDEGLLAKTSVPVLLATAWRDRRSGRLRIADGKRERLVTIVEGHPVSVEVGDREEDGLGRRLEEAGHVTLSDRRRIEQLARERECPEASAVLALKLLDPKALYVALRHDARQRIAETFAWQGGAYRWEPGTPPDDAAGKPHDVLALLQSQLAKRWGPERLFAELMAAADLVGEITPRFHRVVRQLARGDQMARRAISLVDGRRSLGRILGECSGDPQAAATLWTLLHAGVVRVADTPLADAPPLDLDIELEVSSGDLDRTGAGRRAGALRKEAGPKDEKANALRAEIEERLAGLSQLDHYAALGVATDANAAEIKKTYFKAAKKYHPDALARLGLGDLRDDAARVFARIAEAFETLSDAEKRAAYDRGDGDVPEIDMARLAQAETAFRKGEILAKMGNFQGALVYLENAVEIWPDEPAYQSLLGWALYKQPARDAVRAREHLELAADAGSDDAVVLFRLAVVLRALGEGDEAERRMAEARSIDASIDD